MSKKTPLKEPALGLIGKAKGFFERRDVVVPSSSIDSDKCNEHIAIPRSRANLHIPNSNAAAAFEIGTEHITRGRALQLDELEQYKPTLERLKKARAEKRNQAHTFTPPAPFHIPETRAGTIRTLHTGEHEDNASLKRSRPSMTDDEEDDEPTKTVATRGSLTMASSSVRRRSLITESSSEDEAIEMRNRIPDAPGIPQGRINFPSTPCVRHTRASLNPQTPIGSRRLGIPGFWGTQQDYELFIGSSPGSTTLLGSDRSKSLFIEEIPRLVQLKDNPNGSSRHKRARSALSVSVGFPSVSSPTPGDEDSENMDVWRQRAEENERLLQVERAENQSLRKRVTGFEKRRNALRSMMRKGPGSIL